MANTNFADNRKQKALEELFCPLELSAGIQNLLIFLSVVNIVLSITAFMGNTLILVALHKETSLHPPSKLLYRTLATTDLCVGIISGPLFVAYLLSVLNEGSKICRQAYDAAFFLGFVLGPVSLLTVTAISVDRFLALLLGLRYRQAVTIKRTYLTIVVFWVLSIFCSAVQFWNKLILRWYVFIVISLCLVTSIVSYTKIFLTLRQHQIQVQENIHQEQPRQAIPLNIARYRKAVSGARWVQMALVVCYLPSVIVGAWLTQKEVSSSTNLALSSALTTLVYLNSSLNPALYCWKMEEVRQAVKDTMGQLCYGFC